MSKTNCVIVRVYGRELDQLRSEASRIAGGKKIDWWIERDDKGTRFNFETSEAKKAFVAICANLGVRHMEPSHE
jgi:hypothetical protein